MIANYSTIVGFLCSVIDCLKCILLHYHLIRRYCREFVGNVPTIIGHKLPQRMFRGDGYIEQMIDVTADKLISNVSGMNN